MPASAKGRREAIVTLATTVGLASVDDLSEKFGVTPSTIRRDLAVLEGQRRLARTFGGAIAVTAHPEASLRQRLGEHYEAKKAIGAWSAQQVRVGETVLLDNGSTVAAMAHHLDSIGPFTAATTSVDVALELADHDEVDLIVLGGRYRRLSNGFVGALTEVALEHLTFDRVFLGADAVSPEDGICEADLEQVRLKQLMARRSEHVYVLADSSKLGRRTFHAWLRLDNPWTLVTDHDAAPSLVEAFRDRSVAVVQVP